jgi:hypothetical protein
VVSQLCIECTVDMATFSSDVASSVVFSSSSNQRRMSIVPLLSNLHRHMMVLTNQYTSDYTQQTTHKGASAHGEDGVVAGSGIGIEVYVVELGWEVMSIA